MCKLFLKLTTTDSRKSAWKSFLPVSSFQYILFLGLLMVHIWGTQRSKLFGWLLLSAVTMLFASNVFSSIINLLSPKTLKGGCEISGLFIQFSYMSSVLWFSCMSFLMWKTFRKMTPANVAGQKYTWCCQNWYFFHFEIHFYVSSQYFWPQVGLPCLQHRQPSFFPYFLCGLCHG